LGEAAQGADPEIPGRILGHRTDEIAAQPVELRPGIELSAGVAGEAAAGADPELAMTGDIEGADKIVSEAVGGGEGACYAALAQQIQTIRRADPHIAVCS